MATTLEAAVTDVLTRLDDERAKVWSRGGIALDLQDGYDIFCRRSKCLFDIHVIENLAPIGNYGSDVERYLAESGSRAATTGVVAETWGALKADRRTVERLLAEEEGLFDA